MEGPRDRNRGAVSKERGGGGEKHFLRTGRAQATFSAFSLTMDPAEYTKLAQGEAGHWYDAGKREIVRHWIPRTRGASVMPRG
jgi:hypothetical protein